MHNLTNPNQGRAKKVLCVCSAGLLRSPTAANVLHKEYGFNTRACGVNEDYALIPIDEALVHWADEIVVMESYMKNSYELLMDKDNVTVLDIPDYYEFMNEDLVQLIKDRYAERSVA